MTPARYSNLRLLGDEMYTLTSIPRRAIENGRVLERTYDPDWWNHGPTEHWTDDEPRLYDVTPTKTQMSWDDYGRSGQATGLAVGRLFELAGYGLLFAGIGWGAAQVVKEMRR